MPNFKDPLYYATIGLARSVFAVEGLNFRIQGEENIPANSGAVIAINHTGYLDFVYAGLPARAEKRYIRYMAKSEIFDNPFAGPLMRIYRHIPVDRIDGKSSYEHAVEALTAGELVGVFPEATISRSFEIKTMRSGAVRLAQESGVPIIPMVIVGSQRVWTKGFPRKLGRHNYPIDITVMPPWHPEGEAHECTKQLEQKMQGTLDRMWPDYLETYGPFPNGEYWIPAKYGGGAPTLAEASAEDDAISAERKRVKKLTEDIDKATADTDSLVNKLAQEPTPEQGGGSSTTSEESSSAKTEGRYSGSLDSALEAIQSTIDNLSKEVSVSAKEGASRITDAMGGLAASAQQLAQFLSSPSKVASWAGGELETATAQLLGETKQIRDRLPNRVSERMPELPKLLMVNLPYALLDDEGELSDYNALALEQLVDAGTDIVLLSTHNDEKLAETLNKVAPILGKKPEDIEVIRTAKDDRAGKALEDASAVLARNNIGWDEAAVVAAKKSEIDLLNAAGRGIAMGNADPHVMWVAPWVTEDYDKDGFAEIFTELFADQYAQLEQSLQDAEQDQSAETESDSAHPDSPQC